MIELLTGFPDDVVAVKSGGKVTRADYEDVLIPAIEAAMGKHQKVRVYYEMASDFEGFEAGAIWSDLKVGFGNFNRWERVAVITDIEWLTRYTNAMAFLIPCPTRTFKTSEAQEARDWIVS